MFDKVPVPAKPLPATLAFVRWQGKQAGLAAYSPIVPRAFGLYAREWIEGWKEGIRENGDPMRLSLLEVREE